MPRNQESDAEMYGNAVAIPAASSPEGKVFFLPLGQILPPSIPKKPLNQNKLLRLLTSIRQYGFAEPLLVRKQAQEGEPAHYVALSEAEYLRAAELAGIEKIPCILEENSPNQAQKAAILAEIRQNSGDMFTQAAEFRYLMERYRLTQQEIADAIGTSQSTVANKLRLLRFSGAEQEEIRRLGLSERHARALLRLQSPKNRLQALERVRQGQLTVKDTESLVELFLRQSEQGGEEGAYKSGREAEDADVAMVGMPLWGENPPLEGRFTPPRTSHAQACVGGALEANFGDFSPRKFALQSLEPLYNSLEHTLAIFRKTGKSAVMSRAESEVGVFITIHIPL